MSVIENFTKFYNKHENKQRLLKLLKTEGTFQRFSEVEGFLYTVKIGESEGDNVMLDVALKAGEFTIKTIRKGNVVLSSEEQQKAV